MRVQIAGAAALMLAVTAATHAQSPAAGGMPPPAGMSLNQSAAMGFPQPVRVGDLPGRPLLQPIEAQTLLGQVRSIGRDGAGDLVAVIDLRRWFGLRNRLVAVPTNGMVLVGDAVAAVSYTPAQLWRRPIVDADSTTTLAANATIEVGLAKPSH